LGREIRREPENQEEKKHAHQKECKSDKKRRMRKDGRWRGEEDIGDHKAGV